jgi:hypothetical protein
VISIPVQLHSVLKARNSGWTNFRSFFIEFIAVVEAQTALSCYHSLNNISPTKSIWALAENYRFEPAFVEVIALSPYIPLCLKKLEENISRISYKKVP